MGDILVTPRSATTLGHPALRRLAASGHRVILGPPGRQPSEEELMALLPSCVGYLAGVEPISRRVLQSAPLLRVISRNGTGVDNIDLTAARDRGIAVLRAEGANARGVAELTIAFLFALTRQLGISDAAMKRKAWERVDGIELEGKTLGLVGCGRVGRLVAKMALGLDMKVRAFDCQPDRSFQPGKDFSFGELPEVLVASEFVSLHCPPLQAGQPVLDAKALQTLRPGTYVINTARHDVVDSAALLAELQGGRVAGAAIDVFDEEPPRDFSLLEHPRVIATPHIGGFTQESIRRAVEGAVENLLSFLASPPPEAAISF